MCKIFKYRVFFIQKKDVKHLFKTTCVVCDWCLYGSKLQRRMVGVGRSALMRAIIMSRYS